MLVSNDTYFFNGRERRIILEKYQHKTDGYGKSIMIGTEGKFSNLLFYF